MTQMARTLTTEDAATIKSALAAAGIKARVRKFVSLRVCFVGSWEVVCSTLNAKGFRDACGREFTRFSFNDINGEIFVSRAVV